MLLSEAVIPFLAALVGGVIPAGITVFAAFRRDRLQEERALHLKRREASGGGVHQLTQWIRPNWVQGNPRNEELCKAIWSWKSHGESYDAIFSLPISAHG